MELGHFRLSPGFHFSFLNLECYWQFSLYIHYMPALEALLILAIMIGTDIQIAFTPRTGSEHHRHASLLEFVPDMRVTR